MSYQLLATVAHAFPVMVLPLGEKRAQLKVTPDDLRRKLRARPHAKLLLLNSPSIPRAGVSAAEIEALLQVCVEHQIYFVLPAVRVGPSSLAPLELQPRLPPINRVILGPLATCDVLPLMARGPRAVDRDA